ncbi:hypothetical protein [Aquiflexum lacus]|uniref:hypothetical protein n=1 Tax=Aquiflexum lacus TaxID=2483805 RepID=UPI0018960833|nr:hypothetical protein [Aquiflexum lacus]
MPKKWVKAGLEFSCHMAIPILSQASREFFGAFRLGFSLGVGKEFNLGEKYALLIVPTFNANPFFPTNTEGMTQLGIRSIFAFPGKK